MSEPQVSFLELNAFVDGELQPEAAAQIGRAAALDAELARHIATLQTLRAGVAAIGREVPADRLDIAALQALSRQRGRRWWPRLTGAAGVAAMVGVLALIVMPPPPGRVPPALPPNLAVAVLQEGDVLQMVAAHDHWVAAPRNVAAPQTLDLPSLAGILAAVGMKLARRAPVGLASGRTAVERDFTGPGKCRVSLFTVGNGAAPVGSGASRMVAETAGALRLATWSSGEYHLLLTRGMDGTRFAALAQSFANALGGKDNGRAQKTALLSRLFAAPPYCGG